MRKSRREEIALLLALSSYVIFGFSFLFSKSALAVATPFVLLAFRFTVAFVLLNALALTGRFPIRLKGKNIRPLLLLGLVQPIVYFICESYGVRLLSTSLVGTIIALMPVGSLLLGAAILKERPRPFQILCALASVAGVYLTTRGQDSGSFSWFGLVLLLGAVGAASGFNVLSRKISGDFTAFERTYVMFALGCAAFTGIAVVQCWGDIPNLLLAPVARADFWIAVLYLAGLSSVGAFLMLNHAVTHLTIAQASIFGNITTIVSILAGVLFLKESFGVYQAVGSIVIIASVYGANGPSMQRRARKGQADGESARI
ncbi:MAG TPA: DMT family transporter [Clostridia bacterium]|nr:DMT family transporter [Clostridia bacterium]